LSIVPTLITIIGARPQFIKAAAVSARLASAGIREDILHTGQHYDANMSGNFFSELGIPEPRWNLESGSGKHGAQTAKMLSGIEEILEAERPSAVLLYGDTTSTLAGALAAVKLGIPVAHIEAGLRRYDRTIPEEVNRRLTDHVSDLLFAPTKTAMENLRKEGLLEGAHLVGDVMLDLALDTRAGETYGLVPLRFGLASRGYVYATIHRQENTDVPEKARIIWESFCSLAEDGIPIVLPLHPRTRRKLAELGIQVDRRPGRFSVLDPVSYKESISLAGNARFVATDSGGVQRESGFLGVPCVIINYSTGWEEVLSGGGAVLLGKDFSRLKDLLKSAWKNPPTVSDVGKEFGGGKASSRIVEILHDYLETVIQV